MKIVIDAMGGDYAPDVVVEGAVNALKEYSQEIVLVGDEDRIFNALKGLSYDKGRVEVIGASEKIGMDEPAAISVRRKRDSSIVKGVNLLKERKADVFISAGNTGAVVCASTLSLRMLPGVERSGIAIVFPTLAKPCVLIDVGANIDPKPLHLLQYGIMGDAYSRHILGKNDPEVGLLNIGEEETKGTDFIKETHTLLNESRLNFIGNVEARDIYKGKVDVVVCGGFVGNIVLKVTESFAEATTLLLKRNIKKSFLAMFGALLSMPVFNSIKKKIDYTEYGGAPLLGVDGRVIIAHGSSNPKAIKNSIRVAIGYVEHKVNQHIIEELEAY